MEEIGSWHRKYTAETDDERMMDKSRVPQGRPSLLFSSLPTPLQHYFNHILLSSLHGRVWSRNQAEGR
jgi:hypothetical protein